MKFLVTTFLLFFISAAVAQLKFNEQIQSLINAAPVRYSAFKANFVQLKDKDSVFQSLMTVDRTTENEIF